MSSANKPTRIFEFTLRKHKRVHFPRAVTEANLGMLQSHPHITFFDSDEYGYVTGRFVKTTIGYKKDRLFKVKLISNETGIRLTRINLPISVMRDLGKAGDNIRCTINGSHIELVQHKKPTPIVQYVDYDTSRDIASIAIRLTREDPTGKIHMSPAMRRSEIIEVPNCSRCDSDLANVTGDSAIMGRRIACSHCGKMIAALMQNGRRRILIKHDYHEYSETLTGILKCDIEDHIEVSFLKA